MTPAEHTVAIGERHLVEHNDRVARQLKLIADLKADGHTELVAQAEAILRDMQAFGQQVQSDLAAAKERVRLQSEERPRAQEKEPPADDDKMDAVMRDCPM
jgi:hypothetical protein